MKKILYFGQTDNYIQNLQKQIDAAFGEEATELYPADDNIFSLFSTCVKVKPDLIVFDYEHFFKLSKPLIRLVRSCSILDCSYFISVVPETRMGELKKSAALGDQIYFIKSFEVDDVMYCIKSLLAPDMVRSGNVAKAFYADHMKMQEIVRVYYLARNHALIHTNRFFKNGSIPIDFPYYKELFYSMKHKISKQDTSSIHSHFKYSYQMEYQYFTYNLKKEDRDKVMSNFKYDLETAEIKPDLFEHILEVDKPKMMILASDKQEDEDDTFDDEEEGKIVQELTHLAKTTHFNNLLKATDGKPYTLDNITIYDRNYALLKKGTPLLKEEFTSIQMRYGSNDPMLEVKRDKPSVLVVHWDEVNNFDVVKQLITATTQMIDYFPFVMLFGYKDEMSIEVLRDKLEYHFVVATKAPVHEELIIKMLTLYRTKLMEKDMKKTAKKMAQLRDKNYDAFLLDDKLLLDYKIYKDVNDEESLFFYPVDIELLWISEYEIVFKSAFHLEVGEVFKVSEPVDMQVIIVPHIEGSTEASTEACYRALIHWVKESDKQSLRRFVNNVAKLNATKNSTLSEKEIVAMKKQYF
jgi:hypothetical protein